MDLFDLYAKLNLDSKGFDSGIASAKTKLTSFASNMESVSTKVASMGTKLSGLGRTLTTFVTLPVGALAVAAGKTAVEFLQLKENTQTAFEVLLGSGEKAKQMLQDIYDFAQGSPLSYQSYLETGKQLVAMGIAANDVIPYLDKMTNAAIATGKGETGLNTLATAIGRMSTKGKVNLEELNRMTEMGIPAVKILGNAYGKTSSQIFEMMEDGDLLAEEALPKLLEGMEKGTTGVNGLTASYGGLAAKMEGTLTGAIDTVKARWRDMSTKLFDSENTYPKLTEMLENLAKALTKLPKLFESISKAIGPTMDKINEKLEQFSKWIDTASDEDIQRVANAVLALVALGPALIILGTGLKFIAGVITSVKVIIGAFSTVMGLAQGAIHGVSVAMAFLAANPIFLIIGAIVLLVAAFIYFWNTSEEFRNFWINLWDTISKAAITAWNAVYDFFTKTIPEFWNSLIAAFQAGWNAFVSFWTTTIPTFFANAISSIGKFFEELPYMLGFVIGQMIGYIVLFVENLWHFATVTIPQWIEQIIKFFSELPGKIWAWLVQTSVQIYNWGVDIWNKGKTAMTNFVNAVIQFFSELPGKIGNWLVQVVTKISNWGSDLSKKGSQAASELGNSIVNGIKSLPDEIYKIGVNIVNGLWNGINSMIKWIKDKVGKFVQGIKDGFTSVKGFDVQSPSKWAKKTFSYVIEGGIEGFDDSMGDLKKATSGVTDTVRAGLDIGNISYESSLAGQSSGGTSNKDIYGVMNNMLGVLSTYLPDLANMQIALDGKTLVGGLAKPMDNELGVMNALAARGSA